MKPASAFDRIAPWLLVFATTNDLVAFEIRLMRRCQTVWFFDKTDGRCVEQPSERLYRAGGTLAPKQITRTSCPAIPTASSLQSRTDTILRNH